MIHGYAASEKLAAFFVEPSRGPYFHLREM
jgi:hypothetical protein